MFVEDCCRTICLFCNEFRICFVDIAFLMDGQPEKANDLQEGSQSHQSSIKMKVDVPEESASCNKEVNRTPYSPFAQGFPSSRPAFGASGKLATFESFSKLPSVVFLKNFIIKLATFGSSPKLNSATSSSFGSLSSPKPVFLRPSQLAVGNNDSPQQATSCSTFPLKPASLGNPFARVSLKNCIMNGNIIGGDSNENPGVIISHVPMFKNMRALKILPVNEDKSDKTEEVSKTLSDDVASAGSGSSINIESNSDNSSSCTSQITSKSIMSAPKFVPLGTPFDSSSSGSIPSSNVTAASTSSTTATGFIFGQNLHERVATGESMTSETSGGITRASETAGTSRNVYSLCASATTNGTSEMLFTSVIKKDHNESNHNSSSSGNIESGEKPSKSLSEAAREYEEARAVKRKYEEVQVITGEEDEANVLQMNCKLFAFDKAGGTWVERGRGTLRLNDKDSGPGGGVQSRVVIRTTGSLRVVLNTKIWAGMSVDRPSPKSVRLTAMDNSGQIKVFLLKSSPKETEQLHKSLEYRVHLAQRASASQNQTQNETKTSDNDLTSHSLPPEPCSKKRLSEDTTPTPGRIQLCK
ncbi:hypothetical protein L9F63_005315, partial [Diploptera punctata]